MKTIVSFLAWISGYRLTMYGVSMVRDSFEFIAELPEEERIALQRTVEHLACTPMYEEEPTWMMSFRASDERQAGEVQSLMFFIQASVGMGCVTLGFALACVWIISLHVLLR